MKTSTEPDDFNPSIPPPVTYRPIYPHKHDVYDSTLIV